MSITQPPIESRESGQTGDDIDGLLREFFQAALPRPWPAFQRPPVEALPLARPTSWRRRFRSSLALAASLAILALSLGLLSGKFADHSSSVTRGTDTTARKPDKDDAPPRFVRPEK